MFFGRRFARSFVRKNDREARELWKSQIWAEFVKIGLKFGGFSRFVRVYRLGWFLFGACVRLFLLGVNFQSDFSSRPVVRFAKPSG